VTLEAAADTCILGLSPEVDYNFGAQRDAPCGALGPTVGGVRSRLLLRFDLAGLVPPGSTITAATAHLYVTRQPEQGAQSSVFTLHRMLTTWSEGVGTGDLPGGRPALAGETTWNNRHHGDPGSAWATPGGQAGTDFAAAQAAVSPAVSSTGQKILTFTPTGLQALQQILDGTSPNHGWIMLSSGEDTPKSAKRWATRENLTAARHPTLQVTFTPPPPATPVTSLTLDAGAATATLEYLATAGLAYRLESTPSLASDSWTTLANSDPAPADGPQSFTTTTGGSRHHFYKITSFYPEEP
jgi:hypothetical protein